MTMRRACSSTAPAPITAMMARAGGCAALELLNRPAPGTPQDPVCKIKSTKCARRNRPVDGDYGIPRPGGNARGLGGDPDGVSGSYEQVGVR